MVVKFYINFYSDSEYFFFKEVYGFEMFVFFIRYENWVSFIGDGEVKYLIIRYM